MKRCAFLFALVLSLFLVGCAQPEPDEEENGVTTAAATLLPPPTSLPTRFPTRTPIPTNPIPEGSFLPDETATDYMFTLSSWDRDKAALVREAVLETGDTRFIAVFIELVRGQQLGVVLGDYEANVAALEQLSGQNFNDDWFTWVEWYGLTDLTVPPGFTHWKGLILGRIDPTFDNLLRDEFPSTIRAEEIQWGGVMFNGIPALDNPPMLNASEAAYLQPGEAIFGLYLNGEARAYPLRILDWHEMANDVIGGIPVSIAYCTLCGAAIAYDGRGPDGTVYTFGSSGFLYRSNKLMVDRNTNTLWNQLTGQPVLGPLVADELQLNILPIVLTSWQDWQIQHPDTLVVDLNTGFRRVYEVGAAYADYFASSQTMFPVWQRDNQLEDKSIIYAIQIDGLPKAYPLDLLAMEQVVNDTLSDTPLVLIATRGVVTVTGESQRTGETYSYSNGGEVRAFARDNFSFAPGANPDQLIDQNGGIWQVTEESLRGPEGQTLPRLGGHLAYAFGWYAFFPQTLIYGE